MDASRRESYNPNSPAGQIEVAGEFADGLTRFTGWRRRLARWGVVALFAAPFIAVVFAHTVR